MVKCQEKLSLWTFSEDSVASFLRHIVEMIFPSSKPSMNSMDLESSQAAMLVRTQSGFKTDRFHHFGYSYVIWNPTLQKFIITIELNRLPFLVRHPSVKHHKCFPLVWHQWLHGLYTWTLEAIRGKCNPYQRIVQHHADWSLKPKGNWILIILALLMCFI